MFDARQVLRELSESASVICRTVTLGVFTLMPPDTG